MTGTSPSTNARVEQNPHFPDLEQAVLERWESDKTFIRSIQQRDPDNEYVFYDGPPFANGLPHYGHLLTGFVKDAVPRYQTMRGKRVERRFGWDCHGLPAEMEAERSLGVFGRAQIEKYGVEKFNAYCRESVLRYTNEWQRYVTRQARWVDFDDDYKTMNVTFMESVIWAFAELYRKGLVYEGRRVLPYCWECETPLSNFETRLDDSYRMKVDPAVTVGFALDGFDVPTRLWAWTTTPWTLPSNLAVAVSPTLRYAVLEKDGARVVLGESAVERYADELAGYERVDTLEGSALVGRHYTPLFDFFADRDAFRVLSADFVEEGEGTGVVHMAPAFGEDDQALCEANGITEVNPVDARGRFTDLVPAYAGTQVFEANKAIIKDLRAQGSLVRREDYEHSYPHCWRSDTPLIYRSQSSWFVAVSSMNDRMLACNQRINWVPGHIRDGAFGRWLEGARDWSVSRNRFWGTPVPVWVSDDPRYPRTDVYGSIAELARDFGEHPTDLHRPFIDELTRPNPDDPTGKSTMRRVPDVLDVWFDSGSMPYAQVHYPFENREWFDEHAPADFIVEYIGQTRGWFYTLHVLSTALFDRPAFTNAVVHGVLLGDDGRKMSKRLRNFPDPVQMFDEFGADSMRWFLLASPVLAGNDLVVSREAIAEAQRKVIRPLWNAWYFLSIYAAADGIDLHELADVSSEPPAGTLDRYLLSQTRRLVEGMTDALDGYRIQESCKRVEDYLDTLNNWYIRRSRPRFWGSEHTADKLDAYRTLTTALRTVVTAVAPLLPLTAEAIFAGLGDGGSVHLEDWPDVSALPADAELVAAMDAARRVCSAALAIRLASSVRVRQPLQALTVVGPDAERVTGLADVIRDEVNVKQVLLNRDFDDVVDRRLTVDPRRLGPRLGKDVQQVITGARGGDWTAQGDTVVVGGHELQPGEFTLVVQPRSPQTARVLDDGTLIELDVELTDALRAEGTARDVTRAVQAARREAGLDLGDHVRVRVTGGAEVLAAVRAHEADLAAQVQADAVELIEGASGGEPFAVAVERV